MSVRKVKAGLVKKTTVNEFIGEDGNIFFDINDGTLRLSDGKTPGGLTIISNRSSEFFTGLRDTPASLENAQGAVLKVNAQGTAIEFSQEEIFSGDYNDLINTPNIPSNLGDLSGNLDGGSY